MNKNQAEKILFDVLGNYKRLSNEILFFCPDCNHHKPKLSVNIDKNAFKCWVCDYRGRNIRRLIRRCGDYTQLNKWDEITNRIDYNKFENIFDDKEEKQQPQKLDMPESFHSLCAKNKSYAAMRSYKYLINRGLTDMDILRWKIGYCSKGEYKNRIVVPSFDDDGDINYFVARSYTGDSYKYKNPKASKNIVFNELFVDWDSDLVLVEMKLTKPTLKKIIKESIEDEYKEKLLTIFKAGNHEQAIELSKQVGMEDFLVGANCQAFFCQALFCQALI
jgi:hypothetical protein